MIIRLIRIFTFHLLLTVRRPILFFSKLLSLMFLVFFLALIYEPAFHSAPMAAKVMSFTFGIGLILIRWFYDELIFYFAPEGREVTLPL